MEEAGPPPPRLGASAPYRNPKLVAVHIFFKVATLLVYFFGSAYSGDFVMIFVTVVVLLALDFWTVKNVSGRFLVGLRWWNQLNKDGTQDWHFENAPADFPVHPKESFIFWSTLYGTPVLWFIFGLSAILTIHIQWLLLVIVAEIFACSNMYGYYQCKRKGAGSSSLASRLGLMRVGSLLSSSFSSMRGGDDVQENNGYRPPQHDPTDPEQH